MTARNGYDPGTSAVTPQWIGGGVVWGPHPRKYTQRMPKKMRCLAIRSALSAKVRDERVTIVSGLAEIEPRTKAMKTVLAAMPEALPAPAEARRPGTQRANGSSLSSNRPVNTAKPAKRALSRPIPS